MSTSSFDTWLKTCDFDFWSTAQHKVMPPAFFERWAKGEAVLLDVRTDLETDYVALPFALHIPIDELPDRLAEVPRDKLPAQFSRVAFHDTTNEIRIDVTFAGGGRRTLRVNATLLGKPDVFATIGELTEKEPAVAALYLKYGRSPARWIGAAAQRVGNLFLRLLRMVAIPLIITSLASGVMTSLTSPRKLNIAAARPTILSTTVAPLRSLRICSRQTNSGLSIGSLDS